jgi:hypothetical protein
MRYLAFLLCLFCVDACGSDAPPTGTANAAPIEAGAVPPEAGEALQTEPWHYPRERMIDGNRVIVYTPQIRSWPDFTRFEAIAAVEFQPKDGSAARYGTTTISGATEVDLDKRLVIVTEPKVEDVSFPGTGADAHEVTIAQMALRDRVEIPLDVFLLYLSDDVLETPPPQGFNTNPPPIHVADVPTLLLFVNGNPVLTPVEKTGLELVVNANFPVLRDTASGTYYLITGPQRLQARDLKGPWTKAGDLPAGFAQIDPKGEQASIAAAVATPVSDKPLPKVIVSQGPAELIVTEGKPQLKEIPGTGGLQYVENTDSPLFELEGTYYFLVSGRWFETKRLDKGPWKFVPNLPDAFSQIPQDSEMADVRASVPGTVEAKMAALEALLPTRKSVAVGAAPDVNVTYGGDPKFEKIEGTQVSRAVNSGNDVILYNGTYYLVYEGAWYTSASPSGPWVATATVPDAIYKIPPSSPSYSVTQVVVQEATPTTIVYSYPPSYSTSVYVAYGVPWYGTGWYYPPYIYGPYYYPYWGASYGHGYWYSPMTGAYGSRSVWYGPYGGYSYSQGYNPATGRYGYAETAWDGEDWKSHSEKYNPRTGVATETSRHYSANDNKAEMTRAVEGPNGRSVEMQRNTDFDNQTMTTKRETGSGGASNTTRTWDGQGNTTTSGTIKSGDGRTATISGEHTYGEGNTTITGSEGGQASVDRSVGPGGTVTRDGTYSKDGQTIDTTTKRSGDTTATKAQGSNGGQAASISNDGNRTTVGQSGSGDVYAGHNGNVYKKTDSGWQHYDQGGWNPVDTPDRSTSSTTSSGQISSGQRERPAQAPSYSSESVQPRQSGNAQNRAGGGEYGGGSYGGGNYGGGGRYDGSYGGSNEMRQLDRDARARSGGYDRFEQRRSMSPSSSRGGFSRGGGRGGGGRRR